MNMAPLALVLAMVLGVSADRGGANTETLWRGRLEKDSIFVRATWVPTRGASWCASSMGHDFEDTVTIRPKYLDYRIEGARGRAMFRDTVSGDEFFFCCDGLDARGSVWKGGLVITIEANGWGCEPAGDCWRQRFVYLDGRATPATSGWTSFQWDPAAGTPAQGTVSEGCVDYPMPLNPRVQGSELLFEPALPADAKEGDLLKEWIIDDESTYCPRLQGAPASATVEFFPTAASKVPSRQTVKAADRIEVISVVIRAARGPAGGLTSRIDRVQVAINGKRAYVTPGGMRAMGFWLGG